MRRAESVARRAPRGEDGDEIRLLPTVVVPVGVHGVRPSWGFPLSLWRQGQSLSLSVSVVSGVQVPGALNPPGVPPMPTIAMWVASPPSHSLHGDCRTRETAEMGVLISRSETAFPSAV